MRDLSKPFAGWAVSLSVLAAGAFFSPVAAARAHDPAPEPSAAAPAAKPASQEVIRLADWVIATRDNQGLPFAIIDKVEAQVFVFAPDGVLSGVAPALVGLAAGDDSTPGIGDRELSGIAPEERTTPAGRFVAAFGPSTEGHDVLWVDYDTAISLHQVIVGDRHERRMQRLESPTPLDNRITYGCINVPAGFYQEVVLPTFTGTEGVVYILPETRPLDEVFPDFRLTEARAAVAPPPEPDTEILPRTDITQDEAFMAWLRRRSGDADAQVAAEPRPRRDESDRSWFERNRGSGRLPSAMQSGLSAGPAGPSENGRPLD